MVMSNQDVPINQVSFNMHNVGNEILDVWRESLAPLFHVEPFNSSLPTNETATSIYELGELICLDQQFNAAQFIRDNRRIAQYDNDYIGLCLWFEGTNEVENGGKRIVANRSAFMMDLGKPINTRASASKCFSIAIPKTMLAQHGLDINNVACLSLPHNDPRLTILAGAIQGVQQALPEIRQSQMDTISYSLCSLIGGLFGRNESSLSMPGVILAVEDQVKEYIRKHIANPSLGVDMIARDLPYSRSSLYRQFLGSGGIAQYIREVRLKRCYEAIISPKNSALTVQSIANSWGFSNGSHFSRVFKAFFGESPTSVRDQARSLQPTQPFPCSTKEQLLLLREWFSRV